MNLEEAKKICKHFDPVENPLTKKMACSHKLADGMCKHPEHFVCELVLWQDRQRIKAEAEHVISMTKLRSWISCPRHYAFQYVWYAKPVEQASALKLGIEFARARARIDSGMDWEIETSGLEPVEIARLETVLEVYSTLPKMSASQEVRVETKITDGVTLVGFIDGLAKDRKRFYEWKYAVGQDGYNRLSLTMQATSYFLGLPEAEEMVVAVAKKPKQEILQGKEELKMTKGKPCPKCKGTGKVTIVVDRGETSEANCLPCDGSGWKEAPRPCAGQRAEDETVAAFKERVRKIIEEKKDEYFLFNTFKRSDFDLDKERRYMIHRLQEMKAATKINFFPPNYTACGMCDYFDVCHSHPKFPECSHGENTVQCQHDEIMTQVRRKGAR